MGTSQSKGNEHKPACWAALKAEQRAKEAGVVRPDGYVNDMKIAIIGTTEHGQAIGHLLANTDHEVTAPAAAEIDPEATAETAYKQAAVSDVLILATRWEDIDRSVAAMGRIPESAVIIDATKPAHPGPRSGAEVLSCLLNTHRVVEAFTQTPQLGETVPICGDDPEAKGIVIDLIRSMGLVPQDCGTLKSAAAIERNAA